MSIIPSDQDGSRSVEQNPLLDNNTSEKSASEIYTDKDVQYLGFLQTRLENAREQKNQKWAQLNNRTYWEVYNENEILANTFVPAKKDKDDVVVSAGTIESKLDALLANVNNLDLSSEVLAYDKEKTQLVELGNALKEIIFQTEETDGADGAGDEEKKILRQRELLKQGTVFVQEEWLRKFEIKKKITDMTKAFDGKFKGGEDNWSKKLELVFEGPSRTLLHGPNVYLGNMTEFFMEKQPYVFAVRYESYDVAKATFGKFENWKYVKKGAVSVQGADNENTIYNNTWRLNELMKDQVEIIIYQDQPNDEFQIVINGVLMLPIGFPLSAVSPMGKYNITKQILKPISANFALGKSFCSFGSVAQLSALIDEMLKLFVLKTRKSFTRPYINNSGKVIPKSVLSPGRISMGIPANALTPVGDEGQGVTSNEYQVLEKLQETIDRNTVSPQFTGQQGKSGTTATEVLELQRQAKLTLGLIIASCTLLEKKLSYLRLWNILQNWFEPNGTKIVELGEARKVVNTYRITSRPTTIDGFGKGERKIVPTDQDMPTTDMVRNETLPEEIEKGYPIRKTYINVPALQKAQLTWYIVIVPKEKETSALNKMLFKEQLNDILTLMEFGATPNVDELTSEYSTIWNRPKAKLFGAPAMAAMGGFSGNNPGGAARSRSNASGAPQLPGGMATS